LARGNAAVQKNMGLTVEESDLRLFMLCADEAQLDMERVQRIKTVRTSKGKARAHTEGKADGDEDAADTAAVSPDKTAKKAKKARDDSDSGSASEADFAAAVKGGGKKKKKGGKGEGKRADSSDEDEVDERVCAMEKQQKVSEVNAMAKALGLDVRANTKESVVDVRRKHDWVMRQKSVSGGVSMILNFGIPIGLPLVENFVLQNFPALDIKGWAESIIAVKDYLHDPVEELWRRHMLTFGMTMDPWLVVAGVLLGSMVIAFACNKFGYNPKTAIASATGLFCGFAGVTKHVPAAAAAAPAAAPRAPPPRPAPPPAPAPAAAPTLPQPATGKRHIQRPVF
jgi:hypothetical protein